MRVRTAFAKLWNPRQPALYITVNGLLAVFGNALYDLAKLYLGADAAGYLRIGLVVLAVLFLLVGLVVALSRRGRVRFSDEHVPRSRGLIVLVGPEKEGTRISAREAIDYHLRDDSGKPVLRYCWLVTTEAGHETAARMKEELRSRGVDAAIAYIDDLTDPQEAFQTIKEIYDCRVPEARLDQSQVVADITGGSKPMALGMTLACAPYGRTMEYIGRNRAELDASRGTISPKPMIVRWEGD